MAFRAWALQRPREAATGLKAAARRLPSRAATQDPGAVQRPAERETARGATARERLGTRGLGTLESPSPPLRREQRQGTVGREVDSWEYDGHGTQQSPRRTQSRRAEMPSAP